MIDEARDASRSHAEWMKMSKTALRLKCNYYQEDSKGTKKTLVDRLVDHFHGSTTAGTSDASDDGTGAVSPTAGPSHAPDNTQVAVQPAADAASGTATDPYDMDVGGTTPPPPNSTTEEEDSDRTPTDDGALSLGEYSDFDSPSDGDSDDSDAPAKRKKRKKSLPTKAKSSKPVQAAAALPPAAVPVSVAGHIAAHTAASAEDMLRAEIRALRSQLGHVALSPAVPAAPAKRAKKRSAPSRAPKPAAAAAPTSTLPQTGSSPVPRLRRRTRAPAQPVSPLHVLPPAPQPVRLAPLPPNYHQLRQQQQQQQLAQQQLLQPAPLLPAPFHFGGPPPPPPPPPQPPQVPPPPQHQPLGTAAHQFQQAGGNPFLPPSVKVSLLRKIHRMEFVELEELLPANQTTSSLAKHESIISIDRRSQTLKFDKDKVKKEKVDTLAKWMLAWNAYMQAYLHYHPQAYFELFSYQKLFCQLANRYKFEACVQYDTNFRLSMANQQTLHADLRSVSYLRVCEEYKSQYLMDHPLPNCYHCKSQGHFSHSCPEKKGSGSSSSSSGASAMIPAASGAQSSFRSRQQGNSGQPAAQQRPQQPSQAQGAGGAQFKPCFRFNGSGNCTKPPCQFMHVCSICFRDHAARDCFLQSSSAFRPGP